MTRLLAWCTGSTLGLVVGFLAGTVVRDRASFATLTAPVRPVEARNAGRGTSGRADGSAPARTAIPAQRDEPCTHTLGALTCPFTGKHTSHAYQSGTWAPDRKSDTDEGIE